MRSDAGCDEDELAYPLLPVYTLCQLVIVNAVSGVRAKGVGSDIDGVINPDLKVPAGTTVELTLVNGDGMMHDVVIEQFGAHTPQFMEKGTSEGITFVPAPCCAYGSVIR